MSLRTAFRFVIRTLVVLGLGAAIQAAHADCPLKLQLTFPDGTRGCLEDYPVAAVKPQGYLVGAAGAIPRHGYFHLAAPRRPMECPQSLAMSVAVGSNLSPSGGADGPRAHVREMEAIANCQRVAGEAVPGGSCECLTIVGNGIVPIPKAEFERISREIASPK